MPQDNYFNSKKFKSLLREFEKAQREGVPFLVSVGDYTDIAAYYADHGSFDEAGHVVDIAQSLYPDSSEPRIMKARLAMMENNDTKEARRLLDKVIDHSEPEYVYTMADILLMENDAGGADKYLRGALDDIDDEEERDDFIMDVVEIFLDHDMPQRAEKWLVRCDDTQSADYKELKGRLLLELGEYAECEDIMNGLIDDAPFSGDYWNTLASAQFMRGNIRESITSSEYSIAIDPNDPDALNNRANGMSVLGNFGEAAKCYKRIVEIYPEDALNHYMLALCRLHTKEIEAAEETLAIADAKPAPNKQRLQPILMDIGLAYGKNGCIDKALSYIDRAEKLCKAPPGEMNVARGQIYLDNGMTDKAREWFARAVNEEGATTHTMMRIMMSMYDNGYIDMAYNILQLLVGANDREVEQFVYAYLAACCYDLGKKREFISNLRKAVRINADTAVAVLCGIFPEDAKPEDYVRLAKDML